MTFAPAIAPLVEFGGLTIENPVYIGKSYDSICNKNRPLICFSMTIPLSYTRKQTSCEAVRIREVLSSVVGNPSEELKKLIVYIKKNKFVNAILILVRTPRNLTELEFVRIYHFLAFPVLMCYHYKQHRQVLEYVLAV